MWYNYFVFKYIFFIVVDKVVGLMNLKYCRNGSNFTIIKIYYTCVIGAILGTEHYPFGYTTNWTKRRTPSYGGWGFGCFDKITNYLLWIYIAIWWKIWNVWKIIDWILLSMLLVLVLSVWLRLRLWLWCAWCRMWWMWWMGMRMLLLLLLANCLFMLLWLLYLLRLLWLLWLLLRGLRNWMLFFLCLCLCLRFFLRSLSFGLILLFFMASFMMFICWWSVLLLSWFLFLLFLSLFLLNRLDLFQFWGFFIIIVLLLIMILVFDNISWSLLEWLLFIVRFLVLLILIRILILIVIFILVLILWIGLLIIVIFIIWFILVVVGFLVFTSVIIVLISFLTFIVIITFILTLSSLSIDIVIITVVEVFLILLDLLNLFSNQPQILVIRFPKIVNKWFFESVLFRYLFDFISVLLVQWCLLVFFFQIIHLILFEFFVFNISCIFIEMTSMFEEIKYNWLSLFSSWVLRIIVSYYL